VTIQGNHRRVGAAHPVAFPWRQGGQGDRVGGRDRDGRGGGKHFDEAEVMEATEVRVDIKVVPRNRLRSIARRR